jgi:hypothetical protein
MALPPRALGKLQRAMTCSAEYLLAAVGFKVTSQLRTTTGRLLNSLPVLFVTGLHRSMKEHNPF